MIQLGVDFEKTHSWFITTLVSKSMNNKLILGGTFII